MKKYVTRITDMWYQSKLDVLCFLLLPFSALYFLITTLRRWLYRLGIKKTVKFPVPVLVVGNITVGGTGKTPFVIWLVNKLQSNGMSVGVVSRGYGVAKIIKPTSVKTTSKVSEVGDEPLLIVRHTKCPMVVCADRVQAVRYLLSHHHCDVVVSDDGLQHYAMSRDVEIAILDGARQFGNGYYFPSGPLREPISRLKTVNFVVSNGPTKFKKTDAVMTIKHAGSVVSVSDFTKHKYISSLKGHRVHAVTGIGNPNGFFKMLRDLGLDIIPHVFPDHYNFCKEDIMFSDDLVVMTEKDAVKCQKFGDHRHWFLPITAMLERSFGSELVKMIKEKLK